MTAPIADHLPAATDRRWGGVFRRLEHRHDPAYGSVAVAVCGAMVKRIGPDETVPPCPVCFPLEVTR
ncbi:hypothetical protein [Actinoalloteichus hymeniacidonis]|uniref:Uncharacterized protein n=1 Tax=Actinoalloteichus hymeniacidonis TaxID=340345 RepID=A0AAC9HUP7_9PSEU|nr:hypothetical protein [Actinoalloteichus hymeniacidonis]AOS66072.1 hypothetical protein TL08_26515 [Actinoalloteichus hymeniacidonis]MBB5905824.1 hypothetical protein [Actinoalloteichus hymeniacidonis]